MLVRLHQTPEKPFRSSKQIRNSPSSDIKNQGSGNHLGIFIARSHQKDIGCAGYFVASIIPDGLVNR